MQEDSLHGGKPAAGGRPLGVEAKLSVNLSLVMVVASTAVNRIVISRIVERAGLKVVAAEAQAAPDLLLSAGPCVVVAEEAATPQEQTALQHVLETRSRSSAGLPFLVALSRPGSVSAGGGEADAVVAMPITPESLAPVILRLVEQARTLHLP